MEEEESFAANVHNQIKDPSYQKHFNLDRYYAKISLEEAMEWLTDKEKELIRLLYYELLPLTVIARKYGVTEGTIRYRRDQILKRLRFILNDLMDIEADDLLS